MFLLVCLWPVPSYIVGETELEASKADRSLTDFKYGCVGYSVFLDRKDSSDPQNKQAELPFCVGLEVLYLDSIFFLVFLICYCYLHFSFMREGCLKFLWLNKCFMH